MVRITKVHTGGGDKGETSLLDGSRVGKGNPRVEMYGTIDELNSQLGMVRMELKRFDGLPNENKISIDNVLGRVQQELFDIGGECACTPGKLPSMMVLIGEKEGDKLVEEMDSWLEDVEPLESFIMPTGSAPVASLHVSRTVTRRAERIACLMLENEGEGSVRIEIISYLNRLSDWMFVMGRWISAKSQEEEVLWTPLGLRTKND
ncbi:MAG: ATP:cob(I)alamin adenosyltransferase [Marine Group II euryarchaeote MED-G38]|nr:ATP:cob(I)alamin adenosyltransferase [Euryarchaeota archaeon]PDH23199.1 MAG: ATP:cob(I)alamin adenosyltransferase [Marine Group II euryarchaeote MED-G38]|tara:strand:- start:72120 stop:72734 length:615 start_codon:yes stop_codon:yes gene_type:complete